MCVAAQGLHGCLLARTCAYGYVFETPIAPSDAVMRKYTQAPHPYVFEPPLEPSSIVKAGDSVDLSLVLIGKARQYFHYFLLALQELGRRGLGRDNVPFRVDRCETLQGKPIYDFSTSTLSPTPEPVPLPLDPGPSQQNRFTLRFLSPLRLQAKGTLREDPSLADIVSGLRRRLFLLRYFHEDGDPTPLSGAFLDAAHEARTLDSALVWEDNSRYSTRQHRDVPLGGAVGHIVCEGDVGLLGPLLRAGEYVHVGKNAAFGLGAFRVEREGGA